MTPSGALWVDPARQSGRVCITGTRISTTAVASCVWAGDDPVESYEITLREAVVACWWEATHGDRRYRQRWGKWADVVFDDLWHQRDGWLPQQGTP